MDELRQTIRGLLRSPALVLVAVLTLGLGIGVTVSAFSVVDGVLLKSLPYPHADRLVLLYWRPERSNTPGSTGGNTSPLAAAEAWSQAPAIEHAEAYSSGSVVFVGDRGAERLFATSVRAGFFSMLGASQLRGRLLRPDEDRPGAPPVAIVSYAWWTSHMGGDPAVIGKALTLDSTTYTRSSASWGLQFASTRANAGLGQSRVLAERPGGSHSRSKQLLLGRRPSASRYECREADATTRSDLPRGVDTAVHGVAAGGLPDAGVFRR